MRTSKNIVANAFGFGFNQDRIVVKDEQKRTAGAHAHLGMRHAVARHLYAAQRPWLAVVRGIASTIASGITEPLRWVLGQRQPCRQPVRVMSRPAVRG